MKQVKKFIHYECPETSVTESLGAGIGIAVLDTGIAFHPDLQYKTAGFYDFVHHRRMMYDDNGHGTHVAGILCGTGRASYGTYAGMAPAGHLLVVKVLDKWGNGNADLVIRGMTFVRQHARDYAIRVVNISMGALMEAGTMEEERLLSETEKLWDAGLVVVAAAGNHGPGSGTVTSPGNSKKVITVGALGQGTHLYSGNGPTRDCVCKPDLIAPGSHVRSCHAFYKRRKEYYVEKSGTSMATPIVSGAAALYLSAHPDRKNTDVKLQLRRSCQRISSLGDSQGWGLLHVQKLMEE